MLPSKMSKSKKKLTFFQNIFLQNRHFSKKYKFSRKNKIYFRILEILPVILTISIFACLGLIVLAIFNIPGNNRSTSLAVWTLCRNIQTYADADMSAYLSYHLDSLIIQAYMSIRHVYRGYFMMNYQNLI